MYKVTHIGLICTLLYVYIICADVAGVGEIT